MNFLRGLICLNSFIIEERSGGNPAPIHTCNSPLTLSSIKSCPHFTLQQVVLCMRYNNLVLVSVKNEYWNL